MNKIYKSPKFLIVFAIGAALGIISVIIPPIWIVDVKAYESPLFPMLRTGIEGMSGWSFLFLFLSGMFLGVICPQHKLLWGISTMSLFPILAFMEMMKDPYSHNLWPIEFILYGVAAIPGIVGAYIGAFIRKKFRRI